MLKQMRKKIRMMMTMKASQRSQSHRPWPPSILKVQTKSINLMPLSKLRSPRFLKSQNKMKKETISHTLAQSQISKTFHLRTSVCRLTVTLTAKTSGW